MDTKVKLANAILIEIEEIIKSRSAKSDNELANILTNDARKLAELVIEEDKQKAA